MGSEQTPIFFRKKYVFFIGSTIFWVFEIPDIYIYLKYIYKIIKYIYI